jgi:hypothetical protein
MHRPQCRMSSRCLNSYANNEVDKMRLLIYYIIVLGMFACGNSDSDGQTYSSSNCDGVDTSQAPNRISIINYGDGHHSETRYYDNYCSITYYY